MKKVLFTLIATFAFCGTFFAQQTSHWPDVNTYGYEMGYGVVANINIDNNIITSEDNWANIEVAAFVDGEIRAHAFMNMTYAPTVPLPIVDLYVYANVGFFPGTTSELGKVVTFMLYDHSNTEEYTYYVSDPVVVVGQDHNSYSNPMTISFFHTYTKEIDPYNQHDWYLIASPLNEDVLATNVVGLTNSDYDFYTFEQNPDDGLEWINHRDEEGYALQNGVGYLYANSTGADLTFIGAPYSGNGQITITKEEGDNAEFSGWNLIGNPFAVPASIDRTEFYVMKPNGTGLIAAEENVIAAMEGIFVVANSATETVTFTPVPAQKSEQIVLNITQDGDNAIDRAIVRFGQGGTLPKFMLHPNSTKMYISRDDHDYAVVRSNKTGKLPVFFEPAQDGVYTIIVDAENVSNMRYLHLIDNQAGVDVNLLQNPSYRFEAKTQDEPKRFLLVFDDGTSAHKELAATKGGDSFGFFNNGNWIINNEGDAILQVVDVNGQILSSEEINGSVSKRIDAAPGVYMLRLINGQDMKVQKIVVE